MAVGIELLGGRRNIGGHVRNKHLVLARDSDILFTPDQQSGIWGLIPNMHMFLI